MIHGKEEVIKEKTLTPWPPLSRKKTRQRAGNRKFGGQNGLERMRRTGSDDREKKQNLKPGGRWRKRRGLQVGGKNDSIQGSGRPVEKTPCSWRQRRIGSRDKRQSLMPGSGKKHEFHVSAYKKFGKMLFSLMKEGAIAGGKERIRRVGAEYGLVFHIEDADALRYISENAIGLAQSSPNRLWGNREEVIRAVDKGFIDNAGAICLLWDMGGNDWGYVPVKRTGDVGLLAKTGMKYPWKKIDKMLERAEKPMDYDLKLAHNEDALQDEMIRLEGEGFEKAGKEDVELYDAYSNLAIWVHRDTGKVVLVELDRFRELGENAVQELRDNPLPWTFSLESMKIREKPLEDVLLAVWKKYRNMKMEWE